MFLKRLLAWIISSVVGAYLSRVKFDQQLADRWAEIIKRWPSILGPAAIRRTITVDGGASMSVGLIDIIERSLLGTGTWEPHVLSFLTDHLEEGDCFVDVGANIGFISLFASRLVGDQGLVVSVEPSQVNLQRLCEHLALNKASNVVVASVAAGSLSRLGEIAFLGISNSGTATMRGVRTSLMHRVMEQPLDVLLQSTLKPPKIVKIDVEGYEFHVLRGMTNTLREHRPKVILELTDSFLQDVGHSAREIVEFMEDLGYQCRLLAKSDTSPAGALIHSSDAGFPHYQVDVVFEARDCSEKGLNQPIESTD